MPLVSICIVPSGIDELLLMLPAGDTDGTAMSVISTSTGTITSDGIDAAGTGAGDGACE